MKTCRCGVEAEELVKRDESEKLLRSASAGRLFPMPRLRLWPGYAPASRLQRAWPFTG